MRLARIFALTGVGLLMLGSSHVALAQTTGAVVGTVADAQGATVPGATVSLVSQSRGITIDTQTASTGDFIFPSMLPDTYTVRVSVDGFKTLERRNIAVSPGDRVGVGTMTIELGALSETITVTGEAPMIQSQSGERSSTVTTISASPTSGTAATARQTTRVKTLSTSWSGTRTTAPAPR